MPAYNILFFGISFFIFGIFLQSIRAGWIILAVTIFIALASSGFFFWKREKKYLALLFLSPLVFGGAFYAEAFDVNLKTSADIAYDAPAMFEGKVVDVETSDYSSTKVVIELNEGGKVLVTLRRYSAVAVGDTLTFEGIVKRPAVGGYADYLAKEGIVGTSNFPDVVSVASGGGLRRFLFTVRDEVIGIFRKTLPEKESAFISGLLLGYRGGFSEDFTTAMQTSGTTHLVALSGYNVSLVVTGAMAVFSLLLRRTWAFGFTSLAIFLFVTMTGAEASVVRAAIMGFLVLFATESGRFFDSRNVIMLAAFFMLVLNPKLLVFDVGFELSFAAFLGIMYLRPSFSKSFMDWKGNVSSTFAAQAAVLPIIAGSFGSISPLSLLSNVLVLSFVPVTMAFGFAEALLGFVSQGLASAAAFLTFPFLKFETATIEFFGGLHAMVQLPFSPWLMAAYYGCCIAFVAWRKKRVFQRN